MSEQQVQWEDNEDWNNRIPILACGCLKGYCNCDDGERDKEDL